MSCSKAPMLTHDIIQTLLLIVEFLCPPISRSWSMAYISSQLVESPWMMRFWLIPIFIYFSCHLTSQDSTFRDFAQGAYRLRGIRKGQRLQVQNGGCGVIHVEDGFELLELCTFWLMASLWPIELMWSTFLVAKASGGGVVTTFLWLVDVCLIGPPNFLGQCLTNN